MTADQIKELRKLHDKDVADQHWTEAHDLDLDDDLFRALAPSE